MLCDHPYVKLPTGVKRLDTLLSSEARLATTPFPCGQCLSCRKNRSRVWTHRMLLEQYSHDESCFLTLTLDEEHYDPNVYPATFINFIKRLRYYAEKKRPDRKIRYFGVGEYGQESGRAHYHAAIYGLGIGCDNLFKKAWDKGHFLLGDLSKESAAYMCKYIIKGLTDGSDPYVLEKLDGKLPEFSRKSQGLGRQAAEVIAAKINNCQHTKDGLIVTELQHGKDKLPLGRYLVDKIYSKTNVTEYQKADKLYNYQEEIFEKHLNDNLFYDNVVNEEHAKRKAMKARKKFYSKKGVI